MNNSNQQPINRRTEQRRTSGFAVSLIALAWLSMAASPTAQANFLILQDDFTGTAGSSPDTTTRWETTAALQADYGLPAFFLQNAKLDGAGYLHVSSPLAGGNADMLIAQPSFLTAPLNWVTLTMTVSNISNQVSLGLGGTSGFANSIQVRNDSAALTTLPAAGGGSLGGPLGSAGDWIVLMNTGAGYQESLLGVSAAAGVMGTWTINWITNQVTIYFNNTQVFNTAAGGPALGGATWNVPTASLVPAAYTYSSGDFFLDQVTFEIAPEPSAVMLLCVGALLLGRRMSQQK